MSDTIDAPAPASSESGDDLRSIIGDVYDEQIATDDPPVQERDEHGRFASRATDTTGKTDQPDEAEPVEVAAPATWSEADKAHWTTLSSEAREVVLRRERELDKAASERDERIKQYQPLEDVLAPFRQRHALAGLTDAQAVQRLLHAQATLEQNPRQGWPELMRQFGVDPREIAASILNPQGGMQQPQQQQFRDPRVDQMLADQQRREQEATVSQIETFAKDPEHPHFNAVRHTMGALIAANPDMTLQAAYDQAVWANPETRAQLTSAAKAKEEADRKANEATARDAKRRAAVSVRDTPVSAGSVQRGDDGGSVRDILNELLPA